MAELPEIAKLASQMNEKLTGKTILDVVILQEKCANIPVARFQKRVAGAVVKGAYNKGKWIITSLSNGENILLSLGMGADILYYEGGGSGSGDDGGSNIGGGVVNDGGSNGGSGERESVLSEKFQIHARFTDGSGYTARFWWFGKYLLASDAELDTEPNTKDIGIDPYDKRFTYEYFAALLKGKKTQAKAFLMNQKNVGGIGNMYMHDILFKARLHPQKKVSDLSGGDIKLLYDSITGHLNLSREKGAFAYESDFYGQKGGFTMEYFLVGYKGGQPCPTCGATITEIKSGGSSTFICPECQKL